MNRGGNLHPQLTIKTYRNHENVTLKELMLNVDIESSKQ